MTADTKTPRLMRGEFSRVTRKVMLLDSIRRAPAFSLAAPLDSDRWRDEACRLMKETIDELTAAQSQIAELTAALVKYGRHGTVEAVCEHSKHQEWPCTCGFDAVAWYGGSP